MMVVVLSPGLARASSAVPVPPQTQTAQVAKKIVYNGLNMHARVFQSGLSQEQIIDFYKRRWGGDAKVNSLRSSKIVAHLDGHDFTTIEIQPDGRGSKGTIGTIELPSQDAPRPKLGQGLPMPFGAKVVNDIAYPDDRTPSRTVLLVDKLAPDQNAAYFRSRLIANGWKQANSNECAHGASHCVMEFERGNSNMMFVSQKARGVSQVLMTIQNPDGSKK